MNETFLKSEFVNDSLFCEFAYVIDLDKYVFEIYVGFNQKPLAKTERFYAAKPNNSGYYPVRLLIAYPFDKLPATLTKASRLHEQQEEAEEEADKSPKAQAILKGS